MSPRIFTTGRKENPLRAALLPGEPQEAGRSRFGNAAQAAGIEIIMGQPDMAISILEERIGMPPELAIRLVQDAEAGRQTAVLCETVFLEPKRLLGLFPQRGIPREYRNFRIEEEQS